MNTVCYGLPWWLSSKESACSTKVGSVLGLGRSPRGGYVNPLQYSCLESPMDRGAWWAIIDRVTKSWTPLKRLFIDYAKAFDCVDHNQLWKILEEIEIPDHLTCLLRNLYAGQEATLRTGHGTSLVPNQ